MAQPMTSTQRKIQMPESGLPRLLVSLVIGIAMIWALVTLSGLMRQQDALQDFLTNTLGISAESANGGAEGGLSAVASKLIFAVVAVVVGVGGVWILFWSANNIVEVLPLKWQHRLIPYVFIGPAVALLIVFMIYPFFNTLYTSVSEDVMKVEEIVPEQYWLSPNITQDMVADDERLEFLGYILNVGQIELSRVRRDDQTVLLLVRSETITDRRTDEKLRVYTAKALGFDNYVFAVTDPDMHIAFRNNALWLLFGTVFSVGLGLIIAALVDRVKYETLAKSLIFMPLAISFVGASVIWRFMYAWKPDGRPQIGLLNAIITGLGGEPVTWMLDAPLNTIALIVIMIWLQTGFCMIVLSAAIKGIPAEIIEAAKIDGATELQAFLRITVPMIRGPIITVSTTVFIAVLKVFDVVYVMTNGDYDTEVIANRMFVEMFTYRNFGQASSLAVILLILVIPIMIVNVRNLRQQGIDS